MDSGDDRIFLIRPSKGWRFLNLKELWQFRGLIYFLTWRDIKVRYKQTLIGESCLVPLKPVMTMVVFTIIFNKFAKIDSEVFPILFLHLQGFCPGTFSQSLSIAVVWVSLVMRIW